MLVRITQSQIAQLYYDILLKSVAIGMLSLIRAVVNHN